MYNLSIVLPVFNEEIRLKKTLPSLGKFLKDSKNNKIELIFISDGSTDETNKIINDFINSKKYKISLIKYKKNIGKGYAVKKGVLKARNQWILICDADLSVHPNQFDKWFDNHMIILNKCAYYGSREHKHSRVKASITRLILGFFFRILIKFLFNINLSDTQCGFKVFHRSYAKRIFNKIKSYRFSFDVELTILLKKNKIKVIELPLKWTHKSGSKLSILKDIPRMFFDLLKIKIKHF
jgi:dolichyl-phosphate beta-glucosyltransferase